MTVARCQVALAAAASPMPARAGLMSTESRSERPHRTPTSCGREAAPIGASGLLLEDVSSEMHVNDDHLGRRHRRRRVCKLRGPARMLPPMDEPNDNEREDVAPDAKHDDAALKRALRPDRPVVRAGELHAIR